MQLCDVQCGMLMIAVAEHSNATRALRSRRV